MRASWSSLSRVSRLPDSIGLMERRWLGKERVLIELLRLMPVEAGTGSNRLWSKSNTLACQSRAVELTLDRGDV